MTQPTVLVTGASRGLGLYIARKLAQLGANLVLMARSEARLEETARACAELGVETLAVMGDVSREADCQQVVEEAVRRFGQLDALINNSGIIEPIGPIASTAAEDWQRNWAVNVLGPVLLTQQALPYLRRSQGCIINVSSGAAEKVIGGWGAYSSGKAALNKITEVLASEEPDVRAAAVKPGVIDTDMQLTIRQKGKARMDEANYQRFVSLYEQKVMNSPERPALAVACLALALPKEWSGAVLQWDEARVQQMVDAMTYGAVD